MRPLRWGCKPNSVCPRLLARRESFICCSTPETLCPFGPRNGPFLEFPIWPCTGRGLPCLRDCSWSGELLPHLFTLAPQAITHPRGGLFSVALSVGTIHIVASHVYPEAHAPGLHGIAPYGVRTFLPRLASRAILRPSRINAKLHVETD